MVQSIRQIGVLLIVFCAVFSAHAVDESETRSQHVKPGILPKGNRWKENDVKTYLKLPYLSATNTITKVSVSDMADKLQQTQRIGNYQIGTNETGLVELETSVRCENTDIPWFVKYKVSPITNADSEFENVIFKLYEKDRYAFHVIVYDAASWNRACEDAYAHAIRSVSLWNLIPNYYTVNQTENAYVLSANDNYPQRWHFDLKNRVAIYIGAQVRPENAESRENTEAELDKLIQDITELILAEKPKKEQP